MGRNLEEAPYYHGLLPREDIKVIESRNACSLSRVAVAQMMLKHKGDFLVRMTEPQQKGKREYVISVMFDVEKDLVSDRDAYVSRVAVVAAGEALRHSPTRRPLLRSE